MPNALLTNREKQIIRGEVEQDEFADYQNRIYKIRTNARKRSKRALEEIELLRGHGEEELAEEITQLLLEGLITEGEFDIMHRIQRLEEEISDIEQQQHKIKSLKMEVDKIREMIQQA